VFRERVAKSLPLFKILKIFYSAVIVAVCLNLKQRLLILKSLRIFYTAENFAVCLNLKQRLPEK